MERRRPRRLQIQLQAKQALERHRKHDTQLNRTDKKTTKEKNVSGFIPSDGITIPALYFQP